MFPGSARTDEISVGETYILFNSLANDATVRVAKVTIIRQRVRQKPRVRIDTILVGEVDDPYCVGKVIKISQNRLFSLVYEQLLVCLAQNELQLMLNVKKAIQSSFDDLDFPNVDNSQANYRQTLERGLDIPTLWHAIGKISRDVSIIRLSSPLPECEKATNDDGELMFTTRESLIYAYMVLHQGDYCSVDLLRTVERGNIVSPERVKASMRSLQLKLPRRNDLPYELSSRSERGWMLKMKTT